MRKNDIGEKASRDDLKATCDVLVVGGGPAGATAARQLAEAGLDVILLQKDLNYDKPCGGALPLKAFSEFNLDESLINHTVDALRLTAPSGYPADVPLRDTPLAVVDRQTFDAHLRSLAEAAGVRLIEGRYRSMKNGVAEAVTDAGVLAVNAEYIIAADGVHSTLRKQLTGSRPARVLSLYAKVPGHLTDRCEFRFGEAVAPGHYAWVFVHKDGAHIGLGASDEKAVHGYFETLCRQLGLEETPKAKGYYIPRWKDDLYRAGNVYFVGDAAGQVSPFTYEGIYYAMLSASYAAQAVIKKEPELYERLWRANLRRRFRAMDVLQKLMLRWNWSAEKLVRLQDNPSVRAAALRFWQGGSIPASSFRTLIKGVKLLLRR